MKLTDLGVVADEIPLRMSYVDPGSTNLGTPRDDGVPVGQPFVNTFDDIRGAFRTVPAKAHGTGYRHLRAGLAPDHAGLLAGGPIASGSMVKLYFGGEWGHGRRGKGG